jgi:GH25 family lysozyme M1 (1,4-beta-N-acetylmuramidase)
MFALVVLVPYMLAYEGELVPLDANAAYQKFADISDYDCTFNGRAAKGAGLNGVMMRTGYGMSKDKLWDTFIKSIHDAGLILGTYHYATFHYQSVSKTYAEALANAKAQAHFCVQIMKTTTVDSYAVLDLELEFGASAPWSAEQLTNMSNVFLDILHDAGYKPAIYASADWIFNRLHQDKIPYPLWVAYWPWSGKVMDFTDGEFPDSNYGRQMKAIENRICMWQFTSDGRGLKYGSSAMRILLDYIYF